MTCFALRTCRDLTGFHGIIGFRAKSLPLRLFRAPCSNVYQAADLGFFSMGYTG
jgi:hypothetical protein